MDLGFEKTKPLYFAIDYLQQGVGVVNQGPMLVASFAGALFLFLNGPLWLSNKLRIFARGPEAPGWLSTLTARTSRIAGVAAIFLWLAVASGGDMLRAVLSGTILASGAFLLWNGPLRLATRMPLHTRGPDAPPGFQAGFTWFNRIIGAAAVVIVLWIVWKLPLTGLP